MGFEPILRLPPQCYLVTLSCLVPCRQHEWGSNPRLKALPAINPVLAKVCSASHRHADDSLWSQGDLNP